LLAMTPTPGKSNNSRPFSFPSPLRDWIDTWSLDSFQDFMLHLWKRKSEKLASGSCIHPKLRRQNVSYFQFNIRAGVGYISTARNLWRMHLLLPVTRPHVFCLPNAPSTFHWDRSKPLQSAVIFLRKEEAHGRRLSAQWQEPFEDG
jgi:hypothetical protein